MQGAMAWLPHKSQFNDTKVPLLLSAHAEKIVLML